MKLIDELKLRESFKYKEASETGSKEANDNEAWNNKYLITQMVHQFRSSAVETSNNCLKSLKGMDWVKGIWQYNMIMRKQK